MTVVDGFGVQGSILHYGLVIAFVGSAFILFVYFWKKGRLDMDEEPKFQMMESDQERAQEVSLKEDVHGKTK